MLQEIAGVVTPNKIVTLLAMQLVPTSRSYEVIAKMFLKDPPGLYFIPGKVISNYDHQFIIAVVRERRLNGVGH